jgi:hypothetical protein
LIVPIIDCHQEILSRPDIEGARRPASNYYLKRSAYIQERLLDMYVTAVRSGIKRGYFYGAIADDGGWRELEPIQFEGNRVGLVLGAEHNYHRIGLVYTPIPLINLTNGLLDVDLVARYQLPTLMLESLEDREIFDQVESSSVPMEDSFIVRRNRYTRDPVI